MGCGRVGSALAHTLDQAGHHVAVVDQSSSSFAKLHPDFSGETITGIGFDRDTLLRAGPVSHAPDAFHMGSPTANGLEVLPPSASIEAWMRLDIAR